MQNIQILKRIWSLLLNPKAEWLKIHDDQFDSKAVFHWLILPLIKIVAIVKYISFLLYDDGAAWYIGIIYSVLYFIMWWLIVSISVWIIEKVAVKFHPSVERNKVRLLTLYSTAPIFLTSILASLLPVIAVVFNALALYSVYVFGAGMGTMTKTEPAKKSSFLLASMVLVATIVLVFTSFVFPLLFSLVEFYL